MSNDSQVTSSELQRLLHDSESVAALKRLAEKGYSPEQVSDALATNSNSKEATIEIEHLKGVLRYLRTQARNGTLHPQVVIQNVNRVLGADS